MDTVPLYLPKRKKERKERKERKKKKERPNLLFLVSNEILF